MNASELWNRGRSAAVIACVTVVATVALAGCAGREGATNGEDNTTLSASDQEKLDALYDGTFISPVTEAPAPQPGKNIWIISVGQAVSAAAQGTKGAADAAKAIGWKPKIFDGQFQPNLALQGIQQAIGAGVDGIINYGIDCPTIKTGLEQAKRAGIPVVGVEAKDCPESLMTNLSYEPQLGDFIDMVREFGAAGALWLASQSPKNAKFVELRETDIESVLQTSEGYQDTLESVCPDCKNVVVEFTAADLGPALQQKVQQALLQNPDAVGLFAPYDAVITSGVAAAVMASGRADKIKVMGGGSDEASLDLIRQGRGQDADTAFNSRWEGFASIDWMNRLLNGQTPTGENAPTGLGLKLIDAEHNLPKSGPVKSDVDFESIYLKAWGVGQ